MKHQAWFGIGLLVSISSACSVDDGGPETLAPAVGGQAGADSGSGGSASGGRAEGNSGAPSAAAGRGDPGLAGGGVGGATQGGAAGALGGASGSAAAGASSMMGKGGAAGGGSGGRAGRGGSAGATSGGSAGATSGGSAGAMSGGSAGAMSANECSLSLDGATGKESMAKIPVCCAPSSAEKASVDEVFRLLNEYRVAQGVPALVYDLELEAAVQGHCQHMSQHTFFAHEGPEVSVTLPWDRAELCGTTANAENIAMGQRSAAEVMTAWTNSAGHNTNMISTRSKRVGIGYDDSGRYWGQLFGQ